MKKSVADIDLNTSEMSSLKMKIVDRDKKIVATGFGARESTGLTVSWMKCVR